MADRLRYKRSIVSNETIRRQKQRKKFRRRVFYVFLFLLVNVVFISAAFLVLLKVRNINIEGNDRYSSEEIMSALTVSVGENMYNFKAAEIETEIKTALPYIAGVEVRRKLPSTLELAVEEKDAVIFMNLNDEVYILSADLLVLERAENGANTAGLTELVPGNLKRCIVGEPLRFGDLSSFEALAVLNNSIEAQFGGGEITEIDISSRFDVWLRYKDSYTVFLGNTDNCELKMKFLKKIISELGTEKTGRIDISNVAKGAFKEGEPIKTT